MFLARARKYLIKTIKLKKWQINEFHINQD